MSNFIFPLLSKIVIENGQIVSEGPIKEKAQLEAMLARINKKLENHEHESRALEFMNERKNKVESLLSQLD